MVGMWARTALLLGSLLLTGCAATGISSETTLAKRLADRGPVPLSPDNPFIAANLLLNKEMERSPELKGFIDHRGQPGTLEVERSLLGALRMTLFYPDRGERYSLERVDSTWVISGPLGSTQTPMTPPIASIIEPLAPVVGSSTPKPLPNAPTLIAAGRIAPPESPAPDRVSAGTETSFSSPSMPTPNRDETVRAALKHDATSATANPPAMELPEDRAELLAKLIRNATGRTAEISPRGDVVHYVTNERETVVLIAEWYTDSSLNGPRIARMNGRGPTDRPAIGDSFVIPSYLVTNSNRLSDEAISALSGS